MHSRWPENGDEIDPTHEPAQKREAGYALLEHTADAALRAWGSDPGHAFAQAARGMYAIILGEDPSSWPADREETEAFAVGGEEWDDLLVNWLSELVFRFDTEGFVARQVTFDACTPPRCSGSLTGFSLSNADEPRGVGIKAITYHMLQVKVGTGRTEVQVVFDI